MEQAQLEYLQGHPVRIAPSASATPVYHGVLRKVLKTTLEAELLDIPAGHIGGRFRVEVLHPSGLIRFFTSGECDWVENWRLHLELPDEIEVMQRREHPRVNTPLPTWILPLAPNTDPNAESIGYPPPPQPHGQTVNISVGGASILSWQFLEPGRAILLTLGLPGGKYLVDILATVIRSGPGPSGMWFSGIQFVHPSADVQVMIDQLVTTALTAATSIQSYGKVMGRTPR